MQTVPDTPSGSLAIRKDRTGGAPAAEKMAEDVYILSQYLQGDNTTDITKVFSEKSKKELQQKRHQTVQLVSSIDNSATPKQPQDMHQVSAQKDISIREFCVSVLAEMRKDRDVLIQHVTELRVDYSLLSKVRDDVQDIRHELSLTRDRVSKLEAWVPHDLECDNSQEAPGATNKEPKQVQKTLTKLQKRATDVESVIEKLLSSGRDTTLQVSNNYASITNRLNEMELKSGFKSPDP